MDHGLNRLAKRGSDGPSINKSIMRLPNKELSDRKLNDLGPCVLHSVHDGFRSVVGAMAEVENCLVDYHYLFNTSFGTCRREDFKLVHVEESIATHMILKHGTTRWLSIKPCIDGVDRAVVSSEILVCK